MLKKILTHSLIYAIAPQVPRVVSILILPFLTQHLTTLDYGVSATVAVYTGLFSGIKDLGITVLLVNAFYHSPKTWMLRWRIYYGYLLLWAPLLFLAQCILVWLIVPQEAIHNRVTIALLSSLPVLLFDHTVLIGFRYFQAVKRNATYLAVISIVAGLVIVALNYYFIVVLKMGYMGWFWSIFIGALITFSFYLIPVMKLRFKPVFWHNKRFFRQQMKVSLPMIPHNYSSYLLNSSDRLVMNVLNININNIGVYSLAYTFGSYFEIIGNSMGMAIGPFINDMLAEKSEAAEKRLKTFIFLMQGIFLLGACLVCLWMKEIYLLLIRNEGLRAGYALAIVVIMGYCYRPMYWACVNRLIFYKMTSKLWRISFIAGVINVALNFALIPFFGYQAAAYTSFVTFLYVGFSGFFLNDYKKLNAQDYQPFMWIAVIVCAAATVFLLKDVSVLIKALITLSVLLGGMLYLKKNSYQFKFS